MIDNVGTQFTPNELFNSPSTWEIDIDIILGKGEFLAKSKHGLGFWLLSNQKNVTALDDWIDLAIMEQSSGYGLYLDSQHSSQQSPGIVNVSMVGGIPIDFDSLLTCTIHDWDSTISRNKVFITKNGDDLRFQYGNCAFQADPTHMTMLTDSITFSIVSCCSQQRQSTHKLIGIDFRSEQSNTALQMDKHDNRPAELVSGESETKDDDDIDVFEKALIWEPKYDIIKLVPSMWNFSEKVCFGHEMVHLCGLKNCTASMISRNVSKRFTFICHFATFTF